VCCFLFFLFSETVQTLVSGQAREVNCSSHLFADCGAGLGRRNGINGISEVGLG
jgi:hypothetical protein